MVSARLLFSVAAFLPMLFGSAAARAASITNPWLGGEVEITTPDDAAIGETFDISFAVRVFDANPGWALAFETFLDASDTIDVTGSTWEYQFISDEPAWNLSFSGTVGDAITPVTYDGSGYSIRLYDPVNGDRTWIWFDYNDEVVWTLRDLVMLDVTSFSLTLNEFFNLPSTFDFDVVEGLPIPEPSTGILLCLGLCALAATNRTNA